MPEPISIDDFKKVEIRVGEILSAEKIEGSEKLLKLKVSFGDEERQVLSGIAAYYPEPSALVGKRVPFVTNLAPRMMMGLESQAMILATDSTGSPQASETPPQLFLFETTAAPGSRVK
jgi:methionine--tRNA ligase beta chain